MVDKFEENLGKYTYITLPQIKDYLTISSNTYDAKLSNIFNYATSVIEHYIGQEIVANNYVELFDGGKSSVFVSRLPLNNVYQVTQYSGKDNVLLADPLVNGMPVDTSTDSVIFTAKNNASISSKTKKFNKSSLKLGASDYLISDVVPESLQFEESDFTIEMFVKVDTDYLSNVSVFSINTDADNSISFNLANAYGLSVDCILGGSTTTVAGANTAIESQFYNKKKWAHIAMSRDYENERLRLFYDGTMIANSLFDESNLSFTSNVVIGDNFVGNIDELCISTTNKYSQDFTVPTYRNRPDDTIVLLMHFDTGVDSVHNAVNEFTFTIDTGKITVDSGSYTGLLGQSSFNKYNSGIKVEYNAGYSADSVPYDLQLATLDYIKLLYKQLQDKKSFSLEGESGENFSLSSNLPPHIRRILDLYRIIK